jgi:hypothetical protein
MERSRCQMYDHKDGSLAPLSVSRVSYPIKAILPELCNGLCAL